jgi:hypothetical protein
MKTKFQLLLVTLGLAALSAAAQVPGIISHQGKVMVNGTNYTGSGQFKFALVNAAGTTTYWSHDGSSTGGAAPASAVTLPVARGVFSVNLGDTTVANMTQAIPASVFTNGAVYLRTWFNDGADGSQLLAPDRQIVSVGYALAAGSYVETDPVFASSVAYSITSGQVANWNTAYSWGNHATFGYLTSYTETDPVFAASAAHGIGVGDITAWNAKVPSTRTISTTAPLTGGGDLSADRSLSIAQATNSVSGYLSSNDWSAFNAKVGGVTASSPLASSGGATPNLTIPTASGSQAGALSSADWTTFNGKVSATRNINTTSPLTGGGTLAGDLTLAMPQATSTTSGWLSSTDWTKFNSASGLGGSGTANYVPKFTAASTLGNSLIYDNGTSVGISTNSPRSTYALDVNGSAGVNGYFMVDANGQNNGSLNPASLIFGPWGSVEGIASQRTSAGGNQNGLDFYTSGWKRMSILNGGYVGIGTTSPGSSLQVNGGIRANGGTPGSGGVNNNGYAFNGVNGGDNDSGMFSFGDGEIDFCNNNSVYVYLKPDHTTIRNNVGIGTDSPLAPLHVVGTAFFQNNVGIGASSPWCPLVVEDSATINIGTFTFYPLGGVTGKTSGSGDVSIWSGGRVVAEEFDAVSDARIKEIEGRTDTQAALDRINQLQITDYTYIDKPEHGSQRHVGVIAQEAETVAPDVVSTNTDFIPCIYAKADSTSYDAAAKQLTVVMPQAHGLVVGDVVRFAGASNTVTKTVTAVADANTFVVGDVPAAEPNVFVIGKQVHDFRTVNYQDLFATGLAAIQELTKQNQALQDQNAALLRRVEALEAKLGQ